MLFRIDTLAPAPIAEQIVTQVKDAIARGELRRGDQLPSVRELAGTLAVNPKTVVKAYELLQRDGAIVRRQGAGCFVTDERKGLLATERRRRLQSLARQLVTEAYHLGCSRDEVVSAIAQELETLRSSAES